ncbi:MAG: antibiotic biosynthesis monooxygenase [Flavobacteriaceae bacterium]
MILEVAILPIKSGLERKFEESFAKASPIISSMKGCISHELKKCVEKKGQYMLLVNWDTIEDHEIGFRQSHEYQEWKKLLHHFYDPFPEVLHYS